MNRMEPSLTAKSGFPSRGNVGRRQKRQTQVTRLSCLAQPVTRMGGRLVLKCRQRRANISRDGEKQGMPDLLEEQDYEEF